MGGQNLFSAFNMAETCCHCLRGDIVRVASFGGRLDSPFRLVKKLNWRQNFGINALMKSEDAVGA